MYLILIILVVLMLVGAPGIGYQHGFGWAPSGGARACAVDYRDSDLARASLSWWLEYGEARGGQL